MDDIRVVRRHGSYRPAVPRRESPEEFVPVPAAAAIPAELPAESADTQTVSISISVPHISLRSWWKKTNRRRAILIGLGILVIFIIGFTAGRFTAGPRALPAASAPLSNLKDKV